jgi:para-aminobenzoate synthetase component 1
MSVFEIETLPYPHNTGAWFEAFSENPGAIWLDSADNPQGRFDVFAADPALTLIQQDNGLSLFGPAVSEQATTLIAQHEQNHDTPAKQLFQTLSALRQLYFGSITEVQQSLKQTSRPLTPAEQQWLPGVSGLIGYSVGSVDQPLRSRRQSKGQSTRQSTQDKPESQLDWPQAILGFYAWLVVIDHQEKQAWLAVHQPLLSLSQQSIESIRQHLRPTPPTTTTKKSGTTTSKVSATNTESIAPTPHAAAGQPKKNSDQLVELQTTPDAAYQAQFNHVKNYLTAGDCYQINLTRQFELPIQQKPFALYQQIRQHTQAPYSGFLQTTYGQCLCFSPEQFLTLCPSRHLFTMPIKGTRPRGQTPEEDQAIASALGDSPKDRAENLMIVDLLRNDFGRICEPTSIKVPELMHVHSFASVHHLVSKICGRVKSEISAEAVLAACFPGGSITGAPKRRAMQIIDELEPHDRHAFCGSLVHLGANGTLNANICIRTGIVQSGIFTLWAGGGIVIDSTLATEWQELFWKIQKIMDASQQAPSIP